MPARTAAHALAERLNRQLDAFGFSGLDPSRPDHAAARLDVVGVTQ
jgi:hypothetical protein